MEKIIMGIYALRNIKNEKYYIGKSVNIESRLQSHLSELKRGRGSRKLQAAFKKYGQDNFVTEIIEVVNDKDELMKKEDFYISKFDSIENGYNTKTAIPLGSVGISSTLNYQEYETLNNFCNQEKVPIALYIKEAIKEKMKREGLI